MRNWNRSNWMILVAAVAFGGGCTVEAATGSGTSNTTPDQPPPPPDNTGAQAGTGGTGGTGGADPNAGSGTAPSEACPNPDDHCLPDGIFFASKREWKHGYVYLDAAAQQSPPDGAGVAKFMSRRDGSEMVTKWFYKTRRAQRNELAVGKMVIMFHDNSRDHIYQAPETRTDALGKKWWMSRIVSVAPLASGNYVLVANGYKVAANNLRYIEGDSSPTITVSGTEDAHFLKDDHWLASEKPLKDRGYQYIDVAAPIQAPTAQTKNEGHFLFLRSGKTLWTAHAWKTRPATQDDMKLGARVFMFHDNSRDKVYQKPADRPSALAKKWWTAKVTDNSTAYKGTVTVDGKYQVAVDAIRVPVK
jgi:hypothetical protein